MRGKILFAMRIHQFERFIYEHFAHRENIRQKITTKYYYTAGILHPKRGTLFFLSISLRPLDRALEPRKQIIFISKQNACVAISRAFSGLYIGRKTQCPRNFSENISHISVKRARDRKERLRFQRNKKNNSPS